MTEHTDSTAKPLARQRRRVIVVALVLSGIGGSAFYAATPEEPVYRGIGLRQWLCDFDSHSLYLKQEATEATKAFGTNAVPTLVRLLELRDSPLKRLGVTIAERQSLVLVRHTPATVWHLRAMKSCRVLGPLAQPAIPALIDLLEDPQIGHEAAATLADVQPDLFPLVRAVTNLAFSAEIRLRVARRLGSPAYASREVVATALELAQDDPAAKVRRAATAALERHARLTQERRPGEVQIPRVSIHRSFTSQLSAEP